MLVGIHKCRTQGFSIQVFNRNRRILRWKLITHKCNFAFALHEIARNRISRING